MLSTSSLFSALAPLPPSVVFIGYELTKQPVIPDGAEVEILSEDGGVINLTVYI